MHIMPRGATSIYIYILVFIKYTSTFNAIVISVVHTIPQPEGSFQGLFFYIHCTISSSEETYIIYILYVVHTYVQLLALLVDVVIYSFGKQLQKFNDLYTLMCSEAPIQAYCVYVSRQYCRVRTSGRCSPRSLGVRNSKIE